MGSNSIATDAELSIYLTKILNSEASIKINGKSAVYKASGNASQVYIDIDKEAFSMANIPDLTSGPQQVDMEISVDGYRPITGRQVLVFPDTYPNDLFSFESLQGENKVTIDKDGNVSGYVEIKIPENLPGLFNKQILTDIGEEMDHHYIIMKSLPSGINMKVSAEDVSNNLKSLKINLTGNNKDLVSSKSDIRFSLNQVMIDGLFKDSYSDISNSIFLSSKIGFSSDASISPVIFYDARDGLSADLSTLPVGFYLPEGVDTVYLDYDEIDFERNSSIKVKFADGSMKPLSDEDIKWNIEVKLSDGSSVDTDNIPANGVLGKLIYDDYTRSFEIKVILNK